MQAYAVLQAELAAKAREFHQMPSAKPREQARFIQQEILPRQKRVIQGIESLTPKSQEVRDMHQSNLLASKSLYKGYELLALGIEQHSRKEVDKSQPFIRQGLQAINAYGAKRAKLLEKYGPPSEH